MSDLRVVDLWVVRGAVLGCRKTLKKIFREKVPGMIGTSMFGTLRLKVFKSRTRKIHAIHQSRVGWCFLVILQKKSYQI